MSGARPALRAVDVAGRVPPNDIDAEAAVLSAILLDGRTLDVVASILRPEHFYSASHARIYEAAIELQQHGDPIDIQTVASLLKDRDRLQAVGGVSRLAKIVDATPAVAHLDAHAQIVRDKARVRTVIDTCQVIAGSGYGDYGRAVDFLEEAEQAVFAATRREDSREAAQAFDLMRGSLKRLETVLARGGGITGVQTGFDDLDQRTSGMHAGELIIVAARPGMGKTSFALDIARSVVGRDVERSVDGAVVRPRYGAMVFSLEMPNEQISDRLICAEARIDVGRYRKGELHAGEWDRILEAANRLAQLPLWVDDTAAISVLDVRSKVRRRQAEFDRADGSQKLGLVVLDYMQLMKGDGRSREEEVSGISRGLKALAKELRVPVIALSQLNRAVEARADKRPMLSDLRESGSIEQDADCIQFVFRPEYYVTDKESAAARKMRGYAEVIIAKQRNGPTGRVPLTFHESCTRFETRPRSEWGADD